MTDPARATRQWLAMAVASVLLLRQGGRQERPPAPLPPPAPVAVCRTRRVLSVFCMGMLLVRIAALAGVPTPHARFVPEPWPRTHSDPADTAHAAAAGAANRPP